MGPERRPATRPAMCRSCDETIKKGQEMITMWSPRNRGQYIHFCLECARKIGAMAWQHTDTIKANASTEMRTKIV